MRIALVARASPLPTPAPAPPPQAGPDQLPSQPGQVLRDHSSEVWAVAFSPDGQWAASASKDGSALLWAVTASGRLEGARPLQRQATACQLVAFSPSSQLLLVASLDAAVSGAG